MTADLDQLDLVDQYFATCDLQGLLHRGTDLRPIGQVPDQTWCWYPTNREPFLFLGWRHDQRCYLAAWGPGEQFPLHDLDGAGQPTVLEVLRTGSQP